ncbi:MAG: sensor histidine kinase [Acidimicrobiales bacterium]
MPLRTRLVILLVFFVAIALIATDAITFTSLRNSLTSQVDGQLAQISRSRLGCNGVPYGTYFNFYTPVGQPAEPTAAGFSCKSGLPLPRIAPAIVRQAVASGGLYTTVGSSRGAGQYRVLIQPLSTPQTGPTVLAIAVPLTAVSSTLGNQLRLDLIVSLIVLVALAVAAWIIVRLSTRPLARMAKTAGEIAAGDLTRRVTPTDERTEVGQLGAALNVMLERIEEAFEEKESSEQQLRRFVADASHELRTPLTSIRGYAELFRSRLAERPDDLAAALRRIESESARMGVMIEDLLLLARLDRGRPLALAPVRLSAIAEDAVSDARAIDRSRAVTAAIPPDLTVLGDEQRLRQLVGNLLNNALAHTPALTPIEVAARAGPGNVVRLAVIDHGPGIAEGDRPHVFERFWRADRSRLRRGGGSGLGLSIVAAIVSAHHGRVWVEATPGGGATFVVELPAAGAETPSARAETPSAPAEASATPADATPADAATTGEEPGTTAPPTALVVPASRHLGRRGRS